MAFAIIDLGARGLLPLRTLPFAREPLAITVADRAGQEFEATSLHDEIEIVLPKGVKLADSIIGWKMRA